MGWCVTPQPPTTSPRRPTPRRWPRAINFASHSTRKTWLYSIAKNLALNYLTRNRETVDIEILPLASPRRTPEDEVVSDDVVERIWATAAHRLTPWRLRLLEMNVREDLSTPEIAKRLGISNNHAAVRVSEAKQMVREALEPELIAA